MSDPTPPATVPAVTPADTQPQYEFNDAQNRVINDLALAIVWVRLPLILAGVCQAVIATGLAFRLPRDGAHLIGVVGHVLAAVVCFMLASWLLRAANAFAQITTTAGRDVSHLMTALRNLSSWFDLLAFFVKLYIALLGVLIVLLLFGLLADSFRGPA